jgi:LysR family hca operon transcriptional activator
MELRHLRYFVAVAEEGSLTLAAERRLHTAQPSLSRQIRDLELEVGVDLLARSSRGVVLTSAGKVFLDHARQALQQVERAQLAARRAAAPESTKLAMGFLSGCEPEWLPAVMRVIGDELPEGAVTIASKHSPDLAQGLATGALDAAFLRAEEGHPELAFRTVLREPLVVMLRSDHRLAERDVVDPRDLEGEVFVGMADQAPVLRSITEAYLGGTGIRANTPYRAEYLSMAMSLVASTRAVTLLPGFACNHLTWSVTSRPLAGPAPEIELVLGYSKANPSRILRTFLSRFDELTAARPH